MSPESELIKKIAIEAVCPNSGEPKTIYEHNMVKTLAVFGCRVWEAMLLLKEKEAPLTEAREKIIEECAKVAIAHTFTGTFPDWKKYTPLSERPLAIFDLAYAWEKGCLEQAEDIYNRIQALRSPRGALLDGDLAEQRKIHDQSLPQSSRTP